jgi:hypothetical protein
MRIRILVKQKKVMRTDSLWSSNDMQPRHSPIYSKTKPIRAGWRWRSAQVEGKDGNNYILVSECNARRENWKAVLILNTVDGASVIARYEYHGSHPGLHVHANCDRGASR